MESLADLRAEIDRIDRDLHDLLMERASVAEKVAEAKGPDATRLRPGREAKIMRFLLSRHDGRLPETVLMHIWREILAGALLMQGTFRVAVGPEPGGEIQFWEITRNHFGAYTPTVRYAGPSDAVRAAYRGDADVAVAPWPAPEESGPWWPHLLKGNGDPLRVVMQIPFLARRDVRPAAVLARAPFENTGADRSLVAVSYESGMSRAKLGRLISGADLTLTAFLGMGADEPGGQTLALLELDGHVGEDDARLQGLGEASPAIRAVRPLGGYPIPAAAGGASGQGIRGALG